MAAFPRTKIISKIDCGWRRYRDPYAMLCNKMSMAKIAINAVSVKNIA